MRLSSCLLLTAAFVLAPAARPLVAQTRAPVEPPRPRLAVEADTNDAGAYYREGRRLVERSPKMAADAFYWAARIQPNLAEAYYARRVALLLAREPRMLLEYWKGGRKVRESPEVLSLDSLNLRAIELNPLHLRDEDGRLVHAVFQAAIYQDARMRGVSPNELDNARSELDYLISKELKQAGPQLRAMFALSAGRSEEAQASYREALKSASKDERADVLAALARAYAQGGRPDSAIASFEQALTDLRARDRKTTVRWYESKAVFEHSVGILYERMGRDSAAREAYGRALQEDLAYHPAHLALASLALVRADTTQAISELELAVQLRENDGYLHFALGTALAAAGPARALDAVTHLQRATELEPWFAAPHQLLARLYDGSSMSEEAAKCYRAYLARASRDDQFTTYARERLTRLAATLAGS